MPSDGLISQIFTRMSNTVQSQINSISKMTQKIQNLSNSILQNVQEKFTKFIKTITSKPKSKDDYFKIGGLYFAKKLVFISLFSIGALFYLYVKLLVPNLEGKLWYAKFAINSRKAQQFSGKAKVYDMNGHFIYQGDMSSGSPNGFGIQYDQDEHLIYKGNFNMGKYSGSGEIFDSSGNLVYSGNFESNKYEGSGKMVNSFGKVIYVGNFEKGLKSGKGTEYDFKSGTKKYYGEFKNGKYEGKGMTYDSDGITINYEGDFKDGLYDGSGKKYKNGHLIYDGNFKSGKYSGNGNLYDESSRNIVYSGEFEDGVYSGSGELYDKEIGKICYSGEFKNGKQDGKGVLYDRLGIPVFEGEFKNGAINYMDNFGLSLDEFVGKFGQYTGEENINDNKILVYKYIDSAMVFTKNSDGDYIFQKAILGTKNNFMGIGEEASLLERREILGQAYSSTKYNLNDYQIRSFSMLKVNFESNISVPTDKYILENYFIRFFFNNDKSKIFGIEVGSL